MHPDILAIHSQLDPIETYREAALDLHVLLTNLDTPEWSLPTTCPGWSVADIVAHLIDLDETAVGAPRPEHSVDWDALPHVKDAGSQYTELGVDYRRGTEPSALTTDFLAAVNSLVDFVSQGAPTITVPWVKKELPVDQFLSMRTFDMWSHEQDIRSATNRPGNLATNGARAAMQRMVGSLPFIWGKKVGAAPGESLVVTLTPIPPERLGGSDQITGSVCVVVGPEGKSVFAPATEAVTELELTWPDFANAYTGRVSVDTTRSLATTRGPHSEKILEVINSTP